MARITSLTQKYKLLADDFEDTDGATDGSKRISCFDKAGQFRNALGAEGALAFDGTAGTKISRDMGAAGAFAAGDGWCFHIKADIPSANPAAIRGIGGQSDSAGTLVRAGALNLFLDTAGNLIARFYGATTGDYRQLAYAIVGKLGGKARVPIIWDKLGGILYVNGLNVAATETTAGAPPAWSAALTGTVLTVATSASGSEFIGTLSRPWVGNFQPSASDAVEIFELGGALPERFKFGSQANSVAAGSAISFGAADANVVPTNYKETTFITSEAGQRTGGAGAYFTRFAGGAYGGTNVCVYFSALTRTLADVRVRFWARVDVASPAPTPFVSLLGASPAHASWQDAAYKATVTAGWQQFTLIVPASRIGVTSIQGLDFYQLNTNVGQLDIDDVEVVPLGAVVHLPLDDGLGFQLQDVSSNRLHALMTATGVSHVAPFSGPVPLSGTTNTNGNQQLCGAACVPIGVELEVWAKAESGTPTIDVGNASGGAQIVSAAALTSAWKRLTLVNGYHITTATAIWIKGNSTDVIDVKVFQKDIRL